MFVIYYSEAQRQLIAVCTAQTAEGWILRKCGKDRIPTDSLEYHAISNWQEDTMIKLYDGGIYLVNGTEIIPESEASKVEQLTGKAVCPEEAKKGTIEREPPGWINSRCPMYSPAAIIP